MMYRQLEQRVKDLEEVVEGALSALAHSDDSDAVGQIEKSLSSVLDAKPPSGSAEDLADAIIAGELQVGTLSRGTVREMLKKSDLFKSYMLDFFLQNVISDGSIAAENAYDQAEDTARDLVIKQLRKGENN